MQKKLLPILVALAVASSGTWAEDKDAVTTSLDVPVKATQKDARGETATKPVDITATKKALEDGAKKVGDAVADVAKKSLTTLKTLSTRSKDDKEDTVTTSLEEPVKTSQKDATGETATKPLTSLKSLSTRAVERRRVYQRPDAIKDVAKTDGDAATKPIPTIPASVLRGESQSEKDLTALKAQASSGLDSARKQATTTASTVTLNSSDVIAMKPGKNVYIPISRDHPNRLITPFSHPQVISTSLKSGKKGECGEVCIRDGIIYITTGSTQAVTAFITQKDNEEVAFSVTMLPRAMPPREIKFTLPQAVVDKVNAKRGSRTLSTAEGWEQGQPYVDALRGALRQVALQEIPPGYSLRATKEIDPIPACKHPGLSIDFSQGQVMEGFNLDIYVGVAENVSATPVEFIEQTCGGWRIAAVTSWPLKILKPGQKTEVYVITKKDEEIPSDTLRKPLITREYR